MFVVEHEIKQKQFHQAKHWNIISYAEMCQHGNEAIGQKQIIGNVYSVHTEVFCE